jgi:hypothetical protein
VIGGIVAVLAAAIVVVAVVGRGSLDGLVIVGLGLLYLVLAVSRGRGRFETRSRQVHRDG